ncbi:uncharacterized protein LMH87_007634 [Akanthomyces muscarius]|uniref:Uncharacterized protein n=1 Tax=Akanthomyces muscarius TaxID=2231603 RepID=A0A9W8URB2_AKAMU|nr:uncharacterized protein LMH87_007634 [Akanthomyces muscarius]KAJ4161604.1 hypothetical protein LMH87_007634 [Akanthomyces muscarius]
MTKRPTQSAHATYVEGLKYSTMVGVVGAIVCAPAGAALLPTLGIGIVAGGTPAMTAATAATVAAAEAAAAATGLGATSATATLMAVGPVGWALLGADDLTWDCWKPVVMDNSPEPSRGITLNELCRHPNLRSITQEGSGFIAENILAKKFLLSPVDVGGVLAFHATQI